MSASKLNRRPHTNTTAAPDWSTTNPSKFDLLKPTSTTAGSNSSTTSGTRSSKARAKTAASDGHIISTKYYNDHLLKIEQQVYELVKAMQEREMEMKEPGYKKHKAKDTPSSFGTGSGAPSSRRPSSMSNTTGFPSEDAAPFSNRTHTPGFITELDENNGDGMIDFLDGSDVITGLPSNSLIPYEGQSGQAADQEEQSQVTIAQFEPPPQTPNLLTTSSPTTAKRHWSFITGNIPQRYEQIQIGEDEQDAAISLTLGVYPRKFWQFSSTNMVLGMAFTHPELLQSVIVRNDNKEIKAGELPFHFLGATPSPKQIVTVDIYLCRGWTIADARQWNLKPNETPLATGPIPSTSGHRTSFTIRYFDGHNGSSGTFKIQRCTESCCVYRQYMPLNSATGSLILSPPAMLPALLPALPAPSPQLMIQPIMSTSSAQLSIQPQILQHTSSTGRISSSTPFQGGPSQIAAPPILEKFRNQAPESHNTSQESIGLQQHISPFSATQRSRPRRSRSEQSNVQISQSTLSHHADSQRSQLHETTHPGSTSSRPLSNETIPARRAADVPSIQEQSSTTSIHQNSTRHQSVSHLSSVYRTAPQSPAQNSSIYVPTTLNTTSPSSTSNSLSPTTSRQRRSNLQPRLTGNAAFDQQVPQISDQPTSPASAPEQISVQTSGPLQHGTLSTMTYHTQDHLSSAVSQPSLSSTPQQQQQQQQQWIPQQSSAQQLPFQPSLSYQQQQPYQPSTTSLQPQWNPRSQGFSLPPSQMKFPFQSTNTQSDASISQPAMNLPSHVSYPLHHQQPYQQQQQPGTGVPHYYQMHPHAYPYPQMIVPYPIQNFNFSPYIGTQWQYGSNNSPSKPQDSKQKRGSAGYLMTAAQTLLGHADVVDSILW